MFESPKRVNMQNASYTTNKAVFNGSKYSLKYLKLGLSISCALFDHNAKITGVLNKMSIFLFLWIGAANKQRILVVFPQNKLYWTLSCEATSCPAILCRIRKRAAKKWPQPAATRGRAGRSRSAAA